MRQNLTRTMIRRMTERRKHTVRLETSAFMGAPAAEIFVLGEDAVVGRALELLLGGTNYRVRYVAGSPLEKPDLLDGVRLLILAPDTSPHNRKALLALIASVPAAARIPILELVVDPERVPNWPGRFVLPWPCRMGELKRQVGAAMLAGGKKRAAHRGLQSLVDGSGGVA